MGNIVRKEFIILHHSWSPDNKIVSDVRGVDLYHGSYRLNGNIIEPSIAEDMIARGEKKIEKPWSKGERGYSNGYSILNELVDNKIETFYRRTIWEQNVAAVGFNYNGIHICTIGNFDKEPPTKEMWEHVLEQVRTIAGIANIPVENILGHCFVPGTPVFTKNGIKKIEELAVGDKVLSSTGRWQQIKTTFCRKYNGPTHIIKPKYFPAFEVTEEHPIYCFSGGTCIKNKKLKCRPGCFAHLKNRKCYRKDNFFKFIPAKNITLNSWVAFPKYKEKHNKKQISLKSFVKSVPPKWLELKLKITEKLFELFGWFLAEGYISVGDDSINIAQKETKYIANLIETVFNKKPSEYNYNSKRAGSISLHSRILGRFFKSLFGTYSYNKKIPEIVLNCNSLELLRSFLYGYWCGDGSKSLKRDIYMFATSSPNIMYGLILILSKFDILPSIVIEKPGKVKTMHSGERTETKHTFYRLYISGASILKIFPDEAIKEKREARQFAQDKNYFYFPIEYIKETTYKGNVYNIETEDNTYVTSCLVHNCETFLKLGKAKTKEQAQKIKSCPGLSWDMDLFRKQL